MLCPIGSLPIIMVMTGSAKIIAIAVVAVVAIAGIAGGAFYLMNKDKDDNEIVIATSPDFPNYEYMYGDEFSGIDMDIIRAICEEAGYKPKFENVAFDSIVAGVSTGKYDVGASGITINEERAKKVLFSDAYIQAKQVVLANTAIANEDALKALSKVGVQTGTTGDLYVTDALAEGQIVRYTTYSTAVLALKNGQVDAIVLDNGPAKSFANKESLVVSEIDLGLEAENYGFIFKLGNTEMQQKFNDAIKKLTEDGTIEKIINYYNDANGDKKSYYSSRSESSSSGSKVSASAISGAVSPLTLSTSHSAEAVDVKGSLMDDIHNSLFENDRYKYLVTGLKNTAIITLLALVIGLVLGVMMAIIRSVHDMMGKLKILNVICRVYITIIRGTPVVVQLLIIYFIIFATSTMNSVIIAAIAFGMNSAAYVAEIVRAGINAVPKGQLEAGFSLGLPFVSTMVMVIIPQAIRNILPALCNEGIALLKETSISGYIGITDLTRAGDIIRSQTFDAVTPLLIVATLYLAIVLVLTYLVGRLERRLKKNAV